jgi:preprotein translocase subunit SecA
VADVLGKAFGQPNRPTNLQYTAPTVDGEGGVQQSAAPAGASTGGFANASRNAPCPCGSGRKFKRCHGAPQNTV